MSVVKQLFLDHPASVDESYVEHLGAASGFGGRLILAGLACCIHGLVPGVFACTASDQVRALHRQMEDRRAQRPAPASGALAG